MPRYRFGPFELDSDRSRLQRQGVRLRLQRKPLIVLAALLEEPGKTVSRQQLQGLLWPGIAAVDFDQGLNVAVRKLRDVLGDSRDRPSYIETVAGSGYRFIEAVERLPGSESIGALPHADPLPSTIPRVPQRLAEKTALSRTDLKRRRVRVFALSSGALLAILSISIVLAFPTIEPRFAVHPLKASIVFPSELRLTTSGERGGLAFSPDGSRIVFSAEGPDGRTRLWLRDLDSLTPKEILGTDGGSFPFWSPDGKFMGFFTETELKTVNLADHSVRSLCQVNSARGGTWSLAGVILFARDTRGPIYRISVDGGTPIPTTTLEDGKDTTHRWPMFLSDGKRFVFLQADHQSAGTPGRLFLASLDGGRPSYLGESDSNAIPVSDSLFFVSRGNFSSRG